MFIRVEQDADKPDNIAVTKHKADGSPIGRVSLPKKAALNQRIRLLKPLGVRADIVARINADTVPQDLALLVTARAAAAFNVRHITDHSFKRLVFDNFNSALTHTEKNKRGELVIEWANTEDVCCLDIDFREVPGGFGEFVRNMRRQPAYRLGSKSGSFHLVYDSANGVTALELATIAGFEILRSFPMAKCEFISRTRASVGEPRRITQCSDIATIRTMLYDYETNEMDFTEWLTARGLKLGGRYPHTQCPVNPDNSAPGNDPVVVHTHSIKCFKCQGDGRKFGSRDAGYFPQSALVGGRMKPHAVITMAENLVHYDHVKQEIEKFNFRNEDAEKAFYSSLMKSVHGLDDPRLNMVWHPVGAKNLYRKNGYWVDENNDDVEVKGDAGLLLQLPFVYNLAPDGSLAVDRARMSWAKSTTDLSRLGYLPFRTVSGYQFTRFDDAQTRLLTTLPSYLRENAHAAPVFVSPAKRKSWDECLAVLRRLFPGINLAAVEAHLLGIGCGEYVSGVPLLTLTIGPTGSGKSITAVIAAAIVGQVPRKATEHDGSQKFFESIAENAKHSGIYIYDEIFKPFVSGENRLLTDMLQLSPESAYHKLYVGSVPLDCNPYLNGTDVTIPAEISRNQQIARRFGIIRLHSELKDIPTHLKAQGIDDIVRLRQYLSKDDLHALNSYLSHITDERFSSGRPDFYEELRRLGFGMLRESDEFTDQRALIKEFIAAYFEHKNTEKDTANRLGKGARVVRQSPTEKLWSLFMMLQTEHDRAQGETECNALAESDLHGMSGRKDVPPGAKFVIKKHGRMVGFTLKTPKG